MFHVSIVDQQAIRQHIDAIVVKLSYLCVIDAKRKDALSVENS
jgi:hypothetical protein